MARLTNITWKKREQPRNSSAIGSVMGVNLCLYAADNHSLKKYKWEVKNSLLRNPKSYFLSLFFSQNYDLISWIWITVKKLKAFLQIFTHCWAKKNSAAEEIHSAGWLLSGRVQPLSQMWSTTSFHTTRSLNSLHIFFVMPVKLCTKIAQSDKWVSFTVLQ